MIKNNGIMMKNMTNHHYIKFHISIDENFKVTTNKYDLKMKEFNYLFIFLQALA